MLVQPYLLVVVGSAAERNISARLRKELLPSFQKLEGGAALKLAHLSASRVEAAEDTVTFAPQLFRLQKSVMLSEPLEPLFTPFAPAAS